jgi:hypothetical protein
MRRRLAFEHDIEVTMDVVYLLIAGLFWLAVWGLAAGCARLQSHPRSRS